MRSSVLCIPLLLLSACAPRFGLQPARIEAPVGLERLRFNQLAMRLDLPLFWAVDANHNRAPDPDEVRALRFYPTEGRWVSDGRFTPAYDDAFARIRAESTAPDARDVRVRLVNSEFDHAAPTLVYTDVRALPEAHRAFARRMLTVASQIDALYAAQTGIDALASRLHDADPASRSLFRRNWGPRCLGSHTEREAACGALAGVTSVPVAVYPAALQDTPHFCQTLEARPDGSALLSPFTVVRAEGSNLSAVPYTQAFSEPMHSIATELRAAADAMTDPAETALVAYLRAASQSFESNDWAPADEAWSRMNARNSRWYLRVAPDETYWEPCSQKAGFHLTLALVNRASLVWQDRLTPLQSDMERALAALVAGQYTARTVAFHMPDFIDIAINAGDDRDAFGATIGQSLPNWGAVSAEGRGRTVAMSNLYTDADSNARSRAQAASLLTTDALARLTDDPTVGLVSTILHEATHNLGPASAHRFNGHTSDEAFGGSLSSMLEELKAQSGALYFTDWLRARGVIDSAMAQRIYVDSIVWSLGHVAQGMVTPSGERKAYSQLSAIQLGFLLDNDALRWDANAPSADGAHRGAFSIDFARMPAACEALMQRVMRIKATGDRAGADELTRLYVDGPRVPQAVITERMLTQPQAAFVYAIDL